MTYNSRDGNEFFIHSPQRPIFKMTKAGLFYHDIRHLLNNKDLHILVNNLHSPIPQFQDKNEKYTVRDIKLADRARRFQHITGQPIKGILHAVDNNILQNIPILQEDVRMAQDIYGPSIPHLKGKTVQRKVQHVEPVKITNVPKTTLDKYKEVTICCDLMYISGIGFLITISRHIMFATGSMIKNRKVEHTADGITQVRKLYLHRGFKITHMHTDCEFEPLSKEITSIGINLNCESKKEHVPEIEHFIRTVKERLRSARANMPFKQILT